MVGVILICKSCNSKQASTESLLARETTEVNAYGNTSRVGASFEYLGNTDRVKPIAGTMDGGLTANDGSPAYPVYGKTKSLTDEQKNAVIAENNTLCARPTKNASGTYDKIDKDGFLYNLDGTAVTDGNGEPRRLYKHTAAALMYGGDVADDEPGVIKNMTFEKRSYSSYYNVTGLYAPAGEVVKVEISEEQMEATGGLEIHIGQALYNGQANNIWMAKPFVRMPVILNTMLVNKQTSTLENGVYVCYIGSFLGGPIYIRDESVAFTVKISGAVNYSHYILGVTTEEEFDKNAKSSAPYFDLEVWESGVLHSGPRYAAPTDYDELSKAATLWEKIALVSTQVTNQGIVFLYDPFVAAGAAVAFPGRRSVNCPVGWMDGSLNYDAFVTTGSWGNVHEYHHNFQGGWGFGYTGEVTNNALSLVAYSLFTNISSGRSIDAYGASGLSGWNTYTSATWALQRVNDNNISSTNGLAVYATLLHNLGQDAFIKSKAAGVKYLDKWAEVTHQDFGYYAGLVKDYSTVEPSALAPTSYRPFVPVSCVYQTGRSYVYDGQKRYIETMQPYVIPVGSDLTVDLTPYKTDADGRHESGSIIVGKGLSYRIKYVDSDGINGTLSRTDKTDVYKFTPGDQAYSGKITVTIEIIDRNGVLGGKTADDVDLVLEFKNSHEPNKLTLQRTVYSYADGTQPASAVDAYTSGYAGSTGKTELDNYNVTQNSNTDVWLYEASNKPATAPDSVVREPNSVIEVGGKIDFSESGKYRLVLRGRWNAALFLSFDGGTTYELAAKIAKAKNITSPNFSYDDGTYCDFETSKITDPDGYVYFKSVLVTELNGGKGSFMGLGYTEWQVPEYTAVETDDGTGNKVTHYYDGDGNEVSAEQANNAQPIQPTDPSKVSYVTAYRCDYVPDMKFESDYFYTKQYSYSYSDGDVELVGEAGNLKSPDDGMFNYRGDWTWKGAASTFGHVNIGGKDATLDFEFEGTRFIILASNDFGKNYVVYIDGQETPSQSVNKSDFNGTADYLSPALDDDKHTVVIRCSGEANIAAVALYKE